MSISVNFRLDRNAIRDLRRAALKGAEEAASFILRESQRQVPHAQGILEQSGEVEVDTQSITARVKYSTPYAARLHEHPEYNFRGGRKGKYLEDPVNENKTTILQHMADGMKGGM